jgi:hypothetical protein
MRKGGQQAVGSSEQASALYEHHASLFASEIRIRRAGATQNNTQGRETPYFLIRAGLAMQK